MACVRYACCVQHSSPVSTAPLISTVRVFYFVNLVLRLASSQMSVCLSDVRQ